MATDVEKLIVALEARTKAFENALNKANGVANSRARAIETRFAKMNKALSSSFSQFAGAAARAFAIVGGAAGARNLIDTATRIDNALKVAGLSGKELNDVYDALFASAQKNSAPLESLVTLYSRASGSAKELGASQADLLNFTDKIALALRVSGQSAEESSGALLQLSQALGNGTVQAEEYNSLLDGGRPILQAVAAGLKEAGGSVSELTKLVKDGKISSEAFFNAFLAGSPVLEDQVAGSVLTIDQRLGNLQNSLIDAARRFNESSAVANEFGSAIDGVAKFVAGINFDTLVAEIVNVTNALNSGIATANSFAQSLGQLSGLNNVGKTIVGMLPGDTVKNFDIPGLPGHALTIKQDDLITDRINGAFADSVENAVRQTGDLTEKAIKNSVIGQGEGPAPKGGRLPAAETVKPVSIKDFKAPTGSKSGGGGKRSKQDSYQREVQQIRDRTAALQAETAAQAQINPLINDFGYAAEFARSKQELLNAATKAGIKVTPEVEANIEKLASSYAGATAAADKLAATQDKVRERSEFLGDALYDAFSDLIPQIETGNAALDKFLNTLIEAVAQSVLLGKGPFAAAGGGGAGGLLGGLLSVFGFAKGGIAARGKPVKTFANGGVSRSAAIFAEAGPEAAVPLPDGKRIPVDLRAPSNAGSGKSNLHVTFGVDVDDSGNIMPFVKSVSDARIKNAAPSLLSAAQSQVVPTMSKFQIMKAGADYRG
ncbi:tape measure protein [Rhizobium sp. 768_B6_N1_8]|uniref:tape measure protein n=1 Tax=unclassified Rhizobium TaxID=2613769 RepID=UPI003F242A10